MNRFEAVLMVGAAMWINFQWNYLRPRPRHAWHHRADGRAHWHFRPGRHRIGGWAAAAGVAR